MSALLLIHGAWHGAWCWRKLTPLLEAGGRRVLAPDLPSMGADLTPAGVITLDYWARFIVALVEREAQPVTLVAHSRGGVVASRVAELVPERLRRVVYVAAYLLPARSNVAGEARRDVDSLIPANMIPAASGLTCTVRPEVVRDAFYGHCTEEDVEFAQARLSPEPLKPLVTPLQITPARYGRVPRTYVATRFDRVISPGEQRRMIAASPCDAVFALDADHSPFFSRPEELARILSSI